MEITNEDRERIKEMLMWMTTQEWNNSNENGSSTITSACSLCAGECLGTCDATCKTFAGGMPEVAEREYYDNYGCAYPDCEETCGMECASGCTGKCGNCCGSECMESCSSRCGEACQFSCESACGQSCVSNPDKSCERDFHDDTCDKNGEDAIIPE